jgi:hypothetical protein
MGMRDKLWLFAPKWLAALMAAWTLAGAVFIIMAVACYAYRGIALMFEP